MEIYNNNIIEPIAVEDDKIVIWGNLELYQSLVLFNVLFCQVNYAGLARIKLIR